MFLLVMVDTHEYINFEHVSFKTSDFAVIVALV